VNYDPPGCGGVLADLEIREVGARELRHRTAHVVRSLRAGERVVLTRHGEPQAVMLTIHDAIELLVEGQLAPLAAEAGRDFREGAIEPVEPPGPHPVVLAQQAAEAYRRMKPRDRYELRVAVVGGKAEDGRPVWLRSGRWIVSVSYPDDETVLVGAALEVRELERELIGEEIWLARERRDLERRLHARDLAGLPA
jgi:prevent-host-death family protein